MEPFFSFIANAIMGKSTVSIVIKIFECDFTGMGVGVYQMLTVRVWNKKKNTLLIRS